jgi:hypothetical protein
MDGKRGPSGESGASRPEGASAPSTEPPAFAAQPSIFGPLEVSRLRKDDGRALLVFARSEPPERSAAERDR